jgi:hypothetical protein
MDKKEFIIEYTIIYPPPTILTKQDYKSEKQKADEEYLKKFLADIEKLKAKKEKKYNENEVKYGKNNTLE